MARRLTAKQRMFALEYIICKNGTEAARRAGYAGDDNVLAVQAYDNLRNPKVLELIEARFAEHGMRANEVIERLSEQAAADMGDFLDVRHNWVHVDLDRAKQLNKLHLIKKLKQGKYGVELELYDGQAALRTLAQARGLLKQEVYVELGLTPDLLKRLEDTAKEADIPAHVLFENMVNALADQLRAGGTAGDPPS